MNASNEKLSEKTVRIIREIINKRSDPVTVIPMIAGAILLYGELIQEDKTE